MAIEKTPERATPGRFYSLLAQLCDGLYQSQVRLLGRQSYYCLELFQRRNASSTRLRRSALAFVPALSHFTA